MLNIRKQILLPVLVFSLLITSAARPFQQSNPPANGGPILRITQVDTSQFPRVTVYISSSDVSGEPLSINPKFLVLKENGRIITPDQVNGTGEGAALTTLLAIDTSGSMNSGGKLDIARSVAKDYVYQIRADDRAGIMTFGESSDYVQSVTADQASLITAIDGLKAGGDTAMYDALLKAVEILNPLPGRKAIIVLTDGIDNLSKHTAAEVVQAIGQTGLSISTIGFGKAGQSTGNLTALDEKGLSALAENAGGQYGYANDRASLQKLYEKYGRSLKSEYTITYTSPSALHDGLSRSLTVALSGGGQALTTGGTRSQYNPGGLVPESGGKAPWLMFFALLAGLVLILFAPTLYGLIKRRQVKPDRKSGVKVAPKAEAKPAKPRIKLT